MTKPPSPPPSRPAWLLRKLAISLGSLVVFLAVGEIVCRLAGFETLDGDVMQITGDPDYHYKPAPGQDTWHVHGGPDDPHPVRVHINQYGQRAPDYPLAKPDGELRILGVGDSLMFGPGVEDEETFMAQLQRGYELAPLEAGRVRSANAGMNGYATVHYRDFARTQLTRFRPDLFLIAVFYGNDMVLVSNAKTTVPVPWQSLLYRSALVVWWDGLYRDYVWQAITAAKRGESWESVGEDLEAYRGKQPSAMTPAERRLLWEHSLGHVADIVAAAREADVPAVCLLIPIAAQTRSEAEDPEYGWLAGEIAARGLPVIDALPYLRHDHAANWLPYDEGHLSAAGHRQVARAVLTELRDRGLFP